MSGNITPVPNVTSPKTVNAPQATSAENQKAFLKALDNLSRHVESGDLNAAKKAFVQAAQSLTDVERSKGAAKGNTKDMKKTVDAIGTAFRSNDIKEVKQGVEAAKKALEFAKDSQKVADDVIAKTQRADEDVKEQGNQAARQTTSQSMFNALA